MNPNVSVIVPVYCTEKYLRRCLYSIENQSYKDFELIIVDDGSTDGCSKICDECQENYLNVTVIHKQNGGSASARNIGMDVARGKYIAFIDSDDEIHPLYLETLLNLVEKYNVSIAQCAYEIIQEERKQKKKIYRKLLKKRENIETLYEDSRMFGDRNVKITVWGKIFHRSVVEELRFPTGKIIDDEFFTYKAMAMAGKIVVTSEVLYYYYITPKSVMHIKRDFFPVDNIQEAYNERILFFYNRGDTIAMQLSYKEYAIRLMLIYIKCMKDKNIKNNKLDILNEFFQIWQRVNNRELVNRKERWLLDAFSKFPNLVGGILRN